MKRNLLKLVVLVAAMMMSLGASAIDKVVKKTEMTGEVTSLEALKASKFMLQNSAGQILYTPDGWDVKVAPDLITAVSNKGNGGMYALEDGPEDGQYVVAIYNFDGSRRTFWAGNQCLNSQPVGGNVIFGLSGTAPNYGQDGQNLALWSITYEAGSGFAFHCVGRDIYLGADASAARPVEEVTYWKAYTGYIAGYDKDEVLAAFNAVSAVAKTSETKKALIDAEFAYDLDGDLDKFGDAVNAAIDEVNACAALNAAYSSASLDAAGATAAGEVLAKYEAGEYANVAELQAAYYAAVKAQTTAGANMTLAIVNPSFEDGTINGWTSNNCGAVANNYNFGARTGDKFCERWTAAPGKLSDGTFLQTLSGMPNGKYKLTAELQNREQGNGDAAGHGFFLVANEGQTEGVTNNGETITTYGVVTDGSLTIGVKLEGCTGNWICFDNFQLTYLGTIATDEELADLKAEIEIAKTLGVDVAAYEAGAFTASEVPAAVEALKVAEYVQVNTDYTLNAATLIPDFSEWEGGMVSNKGQHWDGTGTSTYYEQTSAQWGQSSWTNNKKVTVELPKGKYVLYAAGRASAGTACTAYIKVGEVTRTYTSKGDVGYGIATDGTASFDPSANYANDGKGRGFEYRYVAFEITEDKAEIALEVGGEATANHQWMSFTAPVLLTTADNTAILLPVLRGKVTAAKADLEAVKGTAGEGLFLKPQAAYDEYADAVAAAENLLAGEPTAAQINDAISAIDEKAAAFAAAPVTAPDADKLYTFELKLGGETPLYMNLTADGITIAEAATPLKFIATENANQYNLSDEEGNLFVGLAGGNAWTMSTAVDKKAAWTFTALGDGAYRINNLVTVGRFVGTNSAEKEAGKPCYADKKTDNGNVDWIIAEYVAPAPTYTITLVQPEVGGTISADLEEAEEGATVTLDFECDDNYGLAAWTVSYVDSEETKYVEVDDETDSFVMPAFNVNVTAVFEEIPVEDDGLIEIAQSQSPEISDGANRADLVEGEEYNTYTTKGDVSVIIKMYDIDVKDCDYVMIKFAEPIPSGICAAFWAQGGTDNVGIPEGVTEYKYVFADDPKCAIENDILPQITLLTLWNANKVVKIEGVYKHKVPAPTELAKELNVERYPGMGYSVTEAAVDFAEAKEFLGVDEITSDMLRIVNPDGTEIADYAGYDGWFNADGVAETWGSNTKVCVKFWQAIEDGKYEICDMNGADEVGKTYTVKWALVANDKKVVYTINVEFIEKPVVAITFDDLNVVETVTSNFEFEVGSCYQGATATVDVAAILAKLGVESLDDITIFAVRSDGTLDDNYKLGTTDGWRNAAGDWQTWGADAYFFVKANFAAAENQLYEVGTMDPEMNANIKADDVFTAKYAFVKNNDTHDAVVLNAVITMIAPDAINGIALDAEKNVVYDLAGRRVKNVVKGNLYIVNGKKVLVK